MRIKPDYTKAHNNLGLALARQGEVQQAIMHYREALRLKPDWPSALNNLAWILATNEYPEFRDGTDAVQLAEKLCRLTNFTQPVALQTLAAAKVCNK